MGAILSLPILALAATLQSTVAAQIQILGGRPDLVFLLVLAWSIHARLEESVTWAFVGGVMQDLLSATPLGTSSLGMVLLVFGVDLLKQQVYRVGLLMLGGLVIGGTLLQQLVHVAVLLVAGYRITLIDIAYVVFPTMLYNLVFIWPLYWFVRRAQRRIGVGGQQGA